MEGIIEEGKELMGEDMSDEAMDAALIAAAQKVEHYEIASYGTVRNWANVAGMADVAKVLQQTLDEEGATDQEADTDRPSPASTSKPPKPLRREAPNGIASNNDRGLVSSRVAHDEASIIGVVLMPPARRGRLLPCEPHRQPATLATVTVVNSPPLPA